MAIGILSGFTATKITTTADVTVTTAPAYVVARLHANAAAAQLEVFNGSTAAANSVAILAAAANTSDEMHIPIRCDSGVLAQLSVNSATGWVYIR